MWEKEEVTADCWAPTGLCPVVCAQEACVCVRVVSHPATASVWETCHTYSTHTPLSSHVIHLRPRGLAQPSHGFSRG